MQSTAGDAIYNANNTPADTTLIQGIWPLNYLTYHTIWLQNMLCCSRVLHVAPGYSIAPYDAALLQRIPHLLQGMQSTAGDANNYPRDTTLIQGIWPLNYLTYHTIWLQNMLCCSRVLHVAPGYSIAPYDATLLQRIPHLLQGMQSTAGDANNYPSGYHTNTGYMAFELSHISYHMAPEHAMLLQGTPRCSRVLHCSIGCCSTAADTTSTAGDAIYCRGCKQLPQRIPH